MNNMFQPYDNHEYLWKNIHVHNSDEKIDNEIRNNYKTPGHPIAFSNARTIYNYYNKQFPLKRIKKILQTLESYSIHKEFRKGPRNISYARYKRYQFQIDLCFIIDLSEWNDGVKYLFTIIDSFTRYAFVEPLKDKNSLNVLRAFQKVINNLEIKPKTVICDKGNEFINKHFTNYCTQNNIKLVSPKSNIHAAYVERFNRTIQNYIYRFLTENSTNRYIDHLNDIVNSYNNRYHRMIGMSPFEAETNPNANLYINSMISIKEKNLQIQRPSLNIGDKVRISTQKTVFARGYKPQAQTEIFKIRDISRNKQIPLYYLSNYDETENIEGGFYRFELTPVNIDTFRIEKILKRRNYRGQRQVLVKWLGYNEDNNQWIPEADVTNIN